jgi:hypothetical protein
MRLLPQVMIEHSSLSVCRSLSIAKTSALVKRKAVVGAGHRCHHPAAFSLDFSDRSVQ